MSQSWKLAIAMLFFCSTAAISQPPEKKAPAKQEQTTSYWMQAKMDYSTNILAGMATADFEKIEKNADQMRRLGKVEGFIRKNNADYRKQLNRFDRILKNLLAHSRKKDIEATAREYGKLTFSCVQCHQLLRKMELSTGK